MADNAPLLLDATRLIWRRWAGREPTGVDRVCLAYLKRFAPEAQAVVHHSRFRGILDERASAALFDMLDQPPKRFRPAFVSAILRHLRRFDCSGKGRAYLNIGHTGLDSKGFRQWVAKADVKPVYFVHDLIPITHPHFCRAGEADRHRERMRTVLASAAGVIANSQATLDDLRGFALDESLPSPPAVAAWLGTRPLALADEAPRVPDRPTFVVLGTIEARKNHLLLLKVWTRLVERLGADSPRLLIIGQRGWEADEVFRILDRDRRLRGHVVELNDCTDRELSNHLVTARALLFPSQAEGFGLPLIEALGLGVPVIASDLPAFREIGEGIPTFLDASDAEAWEAAIADFALPESDERAAQLEALERYRPPDWESHFDLVEPWLASLDRGPGARSSSRSGS